MAEPGGPGNPGESQRHYRAPCPGCGAPVEFRSAQSTHAVCPYCQSTVVREGEQLSRIGKMAELFDDFSPLQLFAAGRIQGRHFTLVGRLQYAYAEGRWTEWVAQLDGAGQGETPEDRIGTLSEDNGAFVFSLPYALQRTPPEADDLRVGMTTAIDGRPFTVSSNQEVWLHAAQGELSHLPGLGERLRMVELRNDEGLVLSLDYGSAPPTASLGRSVQLADLQLSGLRDASDKEEKGGRNFSCPNCGAPVHVDLESSKSVTCGQCRSIIDLSAGLGAELKFATQDEPVRPLIPLGSKGQFNGSAWQVVGFQHRVGQEPGDDEQFGWSEYLLFNRKKGFCFLVDASDGWSLVAPTTGAPKMAGNANSATYLGKTYHKLYAYNAETTYVAGEFYWQVARGQKSFNRDFGLGKALLSSESTPQELTWSSGDRLDSAAVAQAFGMQAQAARFRRDEVKPFTAAPSLSIGTIIVIVVLILIMLSLLSTCSGSGSGGSYRSSGGSYGGYSSGGSHK
ncbi:DUF4178 domain-containing protein [Xenophilus arseniciresistens]|uniref:DUF4178 domain-containing protein n=1 Tax=Xenophilus arseniciresistens TaxID=1283306 RepID=A0AAE3T391_9BURK|nr:DUF4178 domain-containing protein [Xenophilus arseniciresistens]MDA7419227.1 DUF4178 domain-containing protein [Xenophilus arseniciresistens]